ncbi:MAG: hypothetical protein ACI86M_001310 [Saprospiraceae bacterium]|jgi:hypothetical protein
MIQASNIVYYVGLGRELGMIHNVGLCAHVNELQKISAQITKLTS